VSLLDRLKPAWQHTDAEVRARAVRRLSADQIEVLTGVARNDADSRVRRIAIKKLDEPDVLQELSRTEPDERLRAFAAERAASLLANVAVSAAELETCLKALARLSDPAHLVTVVRGAAHESIRTAALSRLTDQRSLGEVVRKAKDPAVRRAALDQVTDLTVLRSIALAEDVTLAMVALDRIQDREVLASIGEDRKCLRAVRRKAQSRLDDSREGGSAAPSRPRRAREIDLCMALEALAQERDLEHLAEKLHTIEIGWEALSREAPPDETTGQRFAAAQASVQKLIARWEEHQAEKAKERAREEERTGKVEENLAARVALCEELEGLPAGDLADAVEKARAEWRRLGPVEDRRGQALAERFARACADCGDRHERWLSDSAVLARLEEIASQAEEAAHDDFLDAAERRFRSLGAEWAETVRGASRENAAAALGRFDQARVRLAARRKEAQTVEAQAREQNRELARKLLERAGQMATAPQISLREASELLREIDSQADAPVFRGRSKEMRTWKKDLQAAARKLRARMKSQREDEKWKQWANLDVQEKLCARVEALLEVKDLHAAARELKEIGEQWKQAARAPRKESRALWERFRKAHAEVRSRCNAFFRRLSEERARNLELKQAICDKAEALADSTDWGKTASRLRELQQEWRSLGRVPAKEAPALLKRWRTANTLFFSRFKAQRTARRSELEANLQEKQAACQKAEELAESTDWSRATEEIKILQAQWRRIGPVPRARSEEVWKRFREACDRYFDRYKRRDELTLGDNLDKKESLCRDLDALLAAPGSESPPDPIAAARTAQEAWTRWQEIGAVPRGEEARMEERFRKLCEEVVARFGDALRGTDLDPAIARKKREKLCNRLEELAGHARPRLDSPEALAQRLKDALASNTMGGGAAPQDRGRRRSEMLQEAKRLKSNWDRLGPVPGEAGAHLHSRFERAYQRVVGTA
jgi:hypothetical protein